MSIESLTKHLITPVHILIVLMIVACATPKEEEKATEEPEKKGAGKPKIVAVEEEIDFGEIKQGENVEQFFTIKNEGDAVLNIEKARGS